MPRRGETSHERHEPHESIARTSFPLFVCFVCFVSFVVPTLPRNRDMASAFLLRLRRPRYMRIGPLKVARGLRIEIVLAESCRLALKKCCRKLPTQIAKYSLARGCADRGCSTPTYSHRTNFLGVLNKWMPAFAIAAWRHPVE